MADAIACRNLTHNHVNDKCYGLPIAVEVSTEHVYIYIYTSSSTSLVITNQEGKKKAIKNITDNVVLDNDHSNQDKKLTIQAPAKDQKSRDSLVQAATGDTPVGEAVVEKNKGSATTIGATTIEPVGPSSTGNQGKVSSPAGIDQAAVTSAPSKPQTPQVVAPDFDTDLVPDDQNAAGGREVVWRHDFGIPPCQVAVGLRSLDLGWEHPRAIAYADEISASSFNIHYNASADVKAFGGRNPNSDTKLKSGAVSWLRALPGDKNIQTGRRTWGAPYPDGKQLPLQNTQKVEFQIAFANAPKVVVWIAALDFSKAYNWRLTVSASDITAKGFTLHADTWANSVLYKVDVTWIALAAENSPGMQVGTFNITDVRDTSSWNNTNAGTKKFETPFKKSPRVVAGLSSFDVGCGRGFRVLMGIEPGRESVNWTLNASGDSHLYGAGAQFIAYDADVSTVASSLSSTLKSWPD